MSVGQREMTRWLARAGAPEWIKRELSAIRHETAGHRLRRNAAEALAAELRREVARLEGELAELRHDESKGEGK